MTPIFRDFYTGPIVEWIAWALVFGLLAAVAIWAAAKLVRWIYPRIRSGGGSHLGRKIHLGVFRNRHATR